ncbi:hypothetical protein D3C72_608220 [compost metagenome]
MSLQRLKALRSAFNKVPVCQPLLQNHLQHSIGKCRIHPWLDLQMQISHASCSSISGIYDNKVGTVLLSFCEIRHECRLALGDIRSRQNNTAGMRDIRERISESPIDPKCLNPSRGCGRHTESSVIVDITCAQGYPRELAE